jgi:L-fucose mutarotase
MLRTTLLYPQILHALAAAGHGAMVLIADDNYPLTTGSRPDAERVYLNLAPGGVGVAQVLETMLTAIPVEAMHGMRPDDGSEPEIFADFRRMLPGLELQGLDRYAFYEQARGRACRRHGGPAPVRQHLADNRRQRIGGVGLGAHSIANALRTL